MSLDSYKKATNYLCGLQKEPTITLMTVDELQALYGDRSEFTKQQIEELRERLKKVDYENNLLHITRTPTNAKTYDI